MNSSAEPYALTVVMLISAILLYVIGKVAFGRRGHAMYSKASVQATTTKLGPVAGLGATLVFGIVIAIAALPHIGVILTSVSEPGMWYRTVLPDQFTLEHYEGALSHPLAIGSIRNSLLFAAAAVGLDIVIGIAIAHLVVRTKTPGRNLLDALAMLPLAVPGLVMAFGYVAMSLAWPFNAQGPLAGWVDVIGANPNPIPLLIIAYAVRRLPYVVRAASAGLEADIPRT